MKLNGLYSILLIVGALAGCASDPAPVSSPPKPAAPVTTQRTVVEQPDRCGTIPRASFPPAGKCRVWYPGRAVAKQPLPGNCDDLRRKMPVNACLIHSPR